MYMYYFLGYQLQGNTELTEERKKVRAMNTFLLALDGDVDFLPDAIVKVRKNLIIILKHYAIISIIVHTMRSLILGC